MAAGSRHSSRLALVLGILALGAAPAVGAPAEPGACTAEGVTVVVDFTDRGGEVVIGCAPGDPASGREALEAAGFVPTDSMPGMICAIDATPDPCPAEFDGTYWSYWSAAPDGEWTAYQEGADTADPAPGMLEGWRLNDGSAGPGVSPADALQEPAGAPGPATTSPTEEPAAESPAVTAESPAATAGAAVDTVDESDGGLGTGPRVWLVVAALAVAGSLAARVVRRRRA